MESPRSDRILAVVAAALLGIGCVLVLWPFLSSLVWAGVLAMTGWPVFAWLHRKVGRRGLLAASLMTALVTVLLLGPVVAMALGLVDNMAELGRAVSALLKNGLPDAPKWLIDLPLVGHALHDYWQRLAHDGRRLVNELEKLVEPAQSMMLASGRMVGRGVLDMALSVFLVFFFYLHGEALGGRLRVALSRLAGSRADHLVNIVQGTVAGVVYGILGTALAQGVLSAIGFLIAGVPAAVLLGVATFFLSVVPVGPPLIWGGVSLWLFQQEQAGWALFVAGWGFFLVSTVDNVIKPFIISRGSSMPFAVVFLGVLGGVLAFGVIGVFLGPTLLAVGYRLILEWTAQDGNPLSGPN